MQTEIFYGKTVDLFQELCETATKFVKNCFTVIYLKLSASMKLRSMKYSANIFTAHGSLFSSLLAT